MTKTEHYQLPLPSAGNTLDVDVERLRAALIGADAKLKQLEDAAGVDVTALVAAVGALTAIANQLNGHRLEAYQPTETSFARDINDEFIERVTEVIDGENRVTIYTRDDADRVTDYTVEYLGVKRRYTINRDPNTHAYLGETSQII